MYLIIYVNVINHKLKSLIFSQERIYSQVAKLIKEIRIRNKLTQGNWGERMI